MEVECRSGSGEWGEEDIGEDVGTYWRGRGQSDITGVGSTRNLDVLPVWLHVKRDHFCI